METTRCRFTVHSFDADAFGGLAPAALAGYLQEAAGTSAGRLGFGLPDLHRRGLTWVLTRERVEIDQALRWGDTLEVETWPSGLDRLHALRDYRLWRDGVEVGRAFTTWLVLDLATRRPCRPGKVMPEAFHAQTGHVLPASVAPVAAPGPPDIDRRFQVRFADIDANLHVTNASYVAWALEAVEEARWRQQRLASFDIQFLAECTLGSFVRSRAAPEDGGARRHAIVREEDGKELARARTTWAPRG